MDAVRQAAISWRMGAGRTAPDVAAAITKALGGQVISRQTYENFENGRAPKVELLYGLARVMGLPGTDDLLELRLEKALPAVAADIPPADVPVKDAIHSLGAALALDMPDDVRKDLSYLLSNLAERRGSQRHQVELFRLLTAVEATQVVPAQLGGGLDLDQAMSDPPEEHPPATQIGGEQRRGEWDMSNLGTPTDVARRRTGSSRQRKPGEKPAKKSTKRTQP